MSEAFPLGSMARCKVTGIEGRIVAETRHLHRPPEYAIERRGVDNDGHPWPLHWVNFYDLRSVEEKP